MTFEIWYDLVLFNIAKLYSRSIGHAQKLLSEYKALESYSYAFEGDNYKSFEPKDVAISLKSYFDKKYAQEEAKRQAEEKKEREENKQRYAKIRQQLATQPAEERKENSLEFQLGLYIGDTIVRNDLPCLSIDNSTNNPVEVSEEDVAEYERLDAKLDFYKQETGTIANSQEWKDYRAFREVLYKKYLPEYIECYVNKIDSITNWKELKRGIQVALWDSDVCSYRTEVIEIINDDWLRRSKIVIYRDKKFL